MLLSDEVPENARVAYLAFKATIKTHINYEMDRNNKTFHEIPSYVMKTIFFFHLEETPEDFWSDKDMKVKSFNILMDKLYECVQKRKCMHYWIPEINLFEEKNDDDFNYFIKRLDAIRLNYVKHLTSDWLEFNRCVRYHCCPCCTRLYPERGSLYNLEKETWIKLGKCWKCCDCDFSYDDKKWKCDINRLCCHLKCRNLIKHGPINYNAELFEVY